MMCQQFSLSCSTVPKENGGYGFRDRQRTCRMESWQSNARLTEDGDAWQYSVESATQSKLHRQTGLGPLMVQAVHVGCPVKSGALVALIEFGEVKARSLRRPQVAVTFSKDPRRGSRGENMTNQKRVKVLQVNLPFKLISTTIRAHGTKVRLQAW